MAGFTTERTGCWDRGLWWGCSKSVVIAERSRVTDTEPETKAAPRLTARPDFSRQSRRIVHFWSRSPEEKHLRGTRFIKLTTRKIDGARERDALSARRPPLRAPLAAAAHPRDQSFWRSGADACVEMPERSCWDAACGVGCSLRRFHFIACVWIQTTELLLLNSPIPGDRATVSTYDQPRRRMENRLTLLVLLLVFALTSLAHGEFELVYVCTDGAFAWKSLVLTQEEEAFIYLQQWSTLCVAFMS